MDAIYLGILGLGTLALCAYLACEMRQERRDRRIIQKRLRQLRRTDRGVVRGWA